MANQRKPSSTISLKDAVEIVRCIHTAAFLENKFNLNLTINLHMLGMMQPVQESITKFLNHVAEWARYRKKIFHYLWVLENPDDYILNLHILMYVSDLGDDYDDFSKKVVRCWERICGRMRDGAVVISDNTSPQGSGLYFLKGAEKDFCSAVGIDFKDQGTVLGKRWGCSNKLRSATRKPASRFQYRLEYPGFTIQDGIEVPCTRIGRWGMAPELHKLRREFPGLPVWREGAERWSGEYTDSPLSSG